MEPLTENTIHRDMPPSVAIGMTMFLGAALGGYYFFDLLQRWKKVDERLHGIEESCQETSSIVEAHADTIHEHDQRIREKQDYDESNEIEEKKYQTWKGEYHQDYKKVEIMLCRKKETTVKSNQTWTKWNGEKDTSTTVRDFYLGNFNPEFQWEIREGDYYFMPVATETFVEGWDSVLHLEIYVTFSSQQSLLEFIGQTNYEANKSINLALKKCLESPEFQWQRILIESESVQ